MAEEETRKLSKGSGVTKISVRSAGTARSSSRASIATENGVVLPTIQGSNESKTGKLAKLKLPDEHRKHSVNENRARKHSDEHRKHYVNENRARKHSHDNKPTNQGKGGSKDSHGYDLERKTSEGSRTTSNARIKDGDGQQKRTRMRKKAIVHQQSMSMSSSHSSEDLHAPDCEPLLRFRRAVRTIMTLLKATTSSRGQPRSEAKLLSFTQYQDELLNDKRSNYGDGLSFDPFMYKAVKETQISNEAKTIMCLEPAERTPDQLHVALLAFNTAVDAFTEFPIKMQQSLVSVGWYEHFEAKRVIIRQGHTADNFYFILSGRALVTILETDKKTGESRANTVATLKKGNSFGELALMHGAKRSASVTCKDDVELLAVGREDFIDIFMHVEKDKEPEHIQFLRQIDLLKGWPIHKLPWDDPKICLFTYFRRGVVMCRDSNRADWIYVIKSGTCKVLKRLVATSPNVPGLAVQEYSSVDDSKPFWQQPVVSRNLHGRSTTSSLHGSTNNLYSSTDSLYPQNSSKKDKSDTSFKGLPPIRQRTEEEIAALLAEHQRALDQIYRARHENYKPKRVRIRLKEPEPKEKPHSVFVQIQKLGPKQTFGLEHVAFDLMEKCTSVSLVSDGAEAILINKKFFLQYLTDEMRKKLRVTIQPYPTEESLQQKLQDMSNWQAFKSMTVADHILYNKYVHDTLYL